MVTKLDPDAPTRQSRSIHDLDHVCAFLLHYYLLLFSFYVLYVKLLVITNCLIHIQQPNIDVSTKFFVI